MALFVVRAGNKVAGSKYDYFAINLSKYISMSIQQMQEHLIKQVGAVTDESILRMLDEELSFYLQHKDDAKIQLSKKDYEELTMLANESEEGNTISFDEFKNIMDKWRMK